MTFQTVSNQKATKAESPEPQPSRFDRSAHCFVGFPGCLGPCLTLLTCQNYLAFLAHIKDIRAGNC